MWNLLGSVGLRPGPWGHCLYWGHPHPVSSSPHTRAALLLLLPHPACTRWQFGQAHLVSGKSRSWQKTWKLPCFEGIQLCRNVCCLHYTRMCKTKVQVSYNKTCLQGCCNCLPLQLFTICRLFPRHLCQPFFLPSASLHSWKCFLLWNFLTNLLGPDIQVYS